MADTENKNISGAPVGGEPDANTQPQAGLVAQYIKDLSFENPNAPSSFQLLQSQRPQVDLSVNLNIGQGPNDLFEVEIVLKATGKVKGSDNNEVVAFVCELTYAGLFGVRNVPDDARNVYLAITAPTLLFPFARRVIADAMRDGNMPPLMLEPINFQALFQQRMAQQQAANGAEAKTDETPSPAEIN